jgi:hypothetical protein
MWTNSTSQDNQIVTGVCWTPEQTNMEDVTGVVEVERMLIINQINMEVLVVSAM